MKNEKITFCPGPGAYIPEWINNQKEYFGRGDKEYTLIKKKTFSWLKRLSGKKNIVSIGWSASTAAIIAFENFLSGKILIINTGYYSKRWHNHLKHKKFKKISFINYPDVKNLNGKFDWIIFVYVETATCTKYDIKKIFQLKKKLKSKLMLDATATIGLENNHNLSDVMFFSSCKGLFGPTGLGFIAYGEKLKINKVKDFWLDIETHIKAKYTLGYNCMASLYKIIKRHSFYKKKLIFASNYLKNFMSNIDNPVIGCSLKYKIKNKNLKNTIFYIPREKTEFDILFFLGLIKFNKNEIKKKLNKLIIGNFQKKKTNS